MEVVAFFVGLIIGATLGIIAISLCAVASDSDNRNKRNKRNK